MKNLDESWVEHFAAEWVEICKIVLIAIGKGKPEENTPTDESGEDKQNTL